MKQRIAFILGLIFCFASVGFCQGSWSAADTIGFSPRANLTSIAINTKIYTFGGEYLYVPLNTLEVFDVVTNSWSVPVTTGIFTPRTSHISGLVDGKIYLVGGINKLGYDSTIQIFNPASNAWTTIQTIGIHTPRFLATSAVVNGKIYVIGGDTGSYRPTDILEIFDPKTMTWNTPVTSGTFIARTGATASVVNGKIFVIGGGNENGAYYDLQIFDPAINTWTTPATIGTFTPRAILTSCVLYGKIYTFGGFNRSGALTNVEVFDPVKNSWSTPVTNGKFTARGWLTSAVVYLEPSLRIYVLGGDNNAKYLNTNEFYDPSTSEVNSIVHQEEISLTPNPTNGIIKVHNAPTNSLHVLITNILGESVLELEEPNAPEFTLDLTKIPVGTYFAKFSTPNEIVLRKIIKE